MVVHVVGMVVVVEGRGTEEEEEEEAVELAVDTCLLYYMAQMLKYNGTRFCCKAVIQTRFKTTLTVSKCGCIILIRPLLPLL
jgi:hypothetical protein